jgi:hypothetical protein
MAGKSYRIGVELVFRNRFSVTPVPKGENMASSPKSSMQSGEGFKPEVTDLEVAEPYADPELVVGEIVDQVDKMVAEFGNPEGFDSRRWVNQWLDRYVPALGDKPRSLLGTAEGRALVKNVLAMSWSGAYA